MLTISTGMDDISGVAHEAKKILTLKNRLVAVAQESFASIFATQLVDNLVPGALDELGIAYSKGGEANDRKQSGVDLLGV